VKFCAATYFTQNFKIGMVGDLRNIRIFYTKLRPHRELLRCRSRHAELQDRHGGRSAQRPYRALAGICAQHVQGREDVLRGTTGERELDQDLEFHRALLM
jgi:hypothetical protein